MEKGWSGADENHYPYVQNSVLVNLLFIKKNYVMYFCLQCRHLHIPYQSPEKDFIV